MVVMVAMVAVVAATVVEQTVIQIALAAVPGVVMAVANTIAKRNVIQHALAVVKMDAIKVVMGVAKANVRGYAQVDARHHVKMGVQMHVVGAKVVVHMTVLIVKTVVREAV